MLQKLHEGVRGGHFALDIAINKIMDVNYWWATLFKDMLEYFRSYDSC